MTTLQIEWLNSCPVCDNNLHTVNTEDGEQDWPLKYALLFSGKPTHHVMYNINGTIYSNSTLIEAFNLKAGNIRPTKKFPTIKERLLHLGEISRDDYFEEIKLP